MNWKDRAKQVVGTIGVLLAIVAGLAAFGGAAVALSYAGEWLIIKAISFVAGVEILSDTFWAVVGMVSLAAFLIWAFTPLVTAVWKGVGRAIMNSKEKTDAE